MTDDVVAELRNWVTDWNGAAMVRGEAPRDGIHCDVLYDAIDEIVALREERQRMSEGMVQAIVEKRLISDTRDEALEEAATACLRKARDYVIPIGLDNYHDGCTSCAAEIRALKWKPCQS